MRKIGFIGAYDKTDLIMYVGKILTTLRKKVLIIDSTVNQKAKYIVPVINPTVRYVTEFEEMDIAVGFQNYEEIKQYLGMPIEKELPYDCLIIDVDNIGGFEKFQLQECERNYFITSFDVYSLKKGLEILVNLKDMTNLTKVIFSEQILKEDDDYLNYLSLGYKVTWNEYKIYFPTENGDLTVIAENQRMAKIGFRKLSIAYKEGLTYLTEDLTKDLSENNIRRAIKTIEKGA